MNKGDVFMAELNPKMPYGMRPVVIIDNEYVKPLTTMNKRDFIPCVINGKEHYIAQDKIRLSDITLYNFIETITIK